jgi:hypothetical protein
MDPAPTVARARQLNAVARSLVVDTVATSVEDRQVEPTEALRVGEDVDLERSSRCDPRPQGKMEAR